MNRLRALLLRRDDQGVALPIVVMLSVVMMLAIATGLSAATSGLRQTATAQDRTAAYDAAYAGAQDYLIRLNADAGYGQYGDTTGLAQFSAGSTLVAPPTENPAFGGGPTGKWASVQTGGATAACPASPPQGTPCFRYEVDNRKLAASGIVRLRSTGRVDQTTRSIIVTLKRKGFVNYLYYTDYEVQDPDISLNRDCKKYAWEGTREKDCTVQFAPTDVLSGPVHSNDTISVCGSTFNALVTSANPKNPLVSTVSGCSDGTFNAGKARVSKFDLPDSNTAMKAQARSDLVPVTGCLYTGPTVVRFLGTGKMTVWSPWTKFTNVTSSTTAGSKPSKCGAPGDQPGQLGNASGATVDELALNLLYVQRVPLSGDANASASTSIPGGMTCIGSNGTSSVGDAASGVGWRFGPWSFPTNNEAAPDGWDEGLGLRLLGTPGQWTPSKWSTGSPAYGCRNGDLFVSGTVTTQTTAGSDNYVYVVGDVKYIDKTQDLLGLVGQSAVLVWNPVDSDGDALLGSDKDREIHAAILSVDHTFQVQNFNLGGPRGTLTVLGSIAQKFRGTVATAYRGVLTNGYRKDYQYHELLATVPPPYFLAPSTTVYAPSLYMSTAPGWTPTGAAP